jgi:hypothetical protein
MVPTKPSLDAKAYHLWQIALNAFVVPSRYKGTMSYYSEDMPDWEGFFPHKYNEAGIHQIEHFEWEWYSAGEDVKAVVIEWLRLDYDTRVIRAFVDAEYHKLWS